MTVVADILKSKPEAMVHTIAPTDSVFDALQRRADKGIGALLVLKGRTSALTLVRDVMTSKVMFVTPTQTTEECMALMTDNRLRHLPVVESDGKLLGLISIGDLVKGIISEQKFVIEQLEHYISGHRG